jgi:nucleotide-binding universal stress UspA family protein
MFENVIVGIDGRQGGLDAVALAARLATRDARVTLVHVHTGGLNPIHAATPRLVEEEREASLKLLEDGRVSAELAHAELVSAVGFSAGRVLHEEAEKLAADLIVVGSCARGGLGRVMLGDDTRAALNGAPCAVAIAAEGYARHPAPFAKVGVAYDESPESKRALAFARGLAEPTRASIEAHEVVKLPTAAYMGMLPAAVGESIELMVSRAEAQLAELPGVRGTASYGPAGEELADFSGRVDIMLVGSRGYGPLKRMMLGSTSNYLERHARCSLLVVPRPGPPVQEHEVAEVASAEERDTTAAAV